MMIVEIAKSKLVEFHKHTYILTHIKYMHVHTAGASHAQLRPVWRSNVTELSCLHSGYSVRTPELALCGTFPRRAPCLLSESSQNDTCA